MKSIICTIILMFSTGLYAQSSIETDELYLKYEKEYLNGERQVLGREFEIAATEFHSKIGNFKGRNSFWKNKNKERWLQKNFSKIAFNSAEEALDSYAKLNQTKQNLDEVNNKLGNLHRELMQKYDAALIWETLQSRLRK